MEILQETTVWANPKTPNHTYLISDSGKLLAYVKEGQTEVDIITSGVRFSKSRRTFKKVRNAALELLIPKKVEDKTGFVVKSDSGKTYNVLLQDGNYSCNCVGFGYRGKCKHVEQVKKENS
jgi:hypothetical protein